MTLYLNDTKIKTFTFSGGECYVSIADIELKKPNIIKAFLRNSDDIMSLMMLVDAIRNESKVKIEVVIPYFPYARQDRVCNKGESFSCKVMCNIINSLNFSKVTVFDPHSDVVEDNLTGNTLMVEQHYLAFINGYNSFEGIDNKNFMLVCPDKGARKKTSLFSACMKKRFITCSKVRCPETGNILETVVPQIPLGFDFMIVDDICDGGRTFIEIAKKLKQQGSGKIYLYVTHGIFSKGLDILKDYFKHVYCFHTFLQEDDDFLTIIGDNYVY